MPERIVSARDSRTYQMSFCAREAIRTWWPAREGRCAGRAFERAMRQMQIDLIRCHAPAMSAEDAARAAATLAWLEADQ